MSTMLYDAQPVDTHMVDYPIDIDMQAQEPWFDAEAKMDDDVPQNHFTDHDSSLSVEVDMDDHYAENEYEMGEGEENYEEMSADLLDIEVYDVSDPPEDATLPPAEVMESADSQPFDIDSPETAKPFLLPVAATPAMSPLPPADTDLPDAVASEHAEAAAEEPADEGTVVNTDAPVELAIPLPDDENVETPNQFQNLESGGQQERVGASDVDVPQSEEQIQSALEHRPSSENDAEDPAATDPHEISEGVYIDPPPAVLVSFESSDFPDICLFNQPARSRSPSPSTDGRGQAFQVFDLLLHHHPILYYEPLASVFEALRQEEYLSRIPHLVDSELVLDAYDLQLVISEDNVYAREVTLHDLNVLHDGTDVTGPLRLQLRSVIPRFIHRYHQLQAQVSRLNLAATGDEQEPAADSTEQAQNPSEPNQQHEDESHSETVQAEADEHSAGSNGNPADAQEADATPTAEAQHDTPDQPDTVTATEPAEYLEGDLDGTEGNVETEEPVEPREAGDGYGEKLQHEDLDATETGDLPDPPEEDDEEEEQEEEFVVVETPGVAKPLIPLTGAAPAEDIGNEPETTLRPPQSSDEHEHDPDSAPRDSETRNDEAESETAVNNEDATNVLANNSVDSSVQADDFHEESYEEEEPSWEDAVEGDEDADTTWEAEHETASNESSVTLSSKASKRSFEELELDEDNVDGNSPPGSPGAKRTRVD